MSNTTKPIGHSLFDFFEPKKPVESIKSASEVTLRPYQEEAVRRVFEEWESGTRSTLVCLPTGCGKSVVFSEVMRKVCS